MVIGLIVSVLLLGVLYFVVKGICYVLAKVCVPLHLPYIVVVAVVFFEMRMFHGTAKTLFLILAVGLLLRVGTKHIIELGSHSQDDYAYSKDTFQSVLVSIFGYVFSALMILYIGAWLIPSVLSDSENTSGILYVLELYHKSNADIYLLLILVAFAYIKAWSKCADLEMRTKPVVAPPKRNEVALYFDGVLPELKMPDTVSADQAKKMIKEYLIKNIVNISEDVADSLSEELYFCSLADKKDIEQILGELSEIPPAIAEQLKSRLCSQ